MVEISDLPVLISILQQCSIVCLCRRRSRDLLIQLALENPVLFHHPKNRKECKEGGLLISKNGPSTILTVAEVSNHPMDQESCYSDCSTCGKAEKNFSCSLQRHEYVGSIDSHNSASLNF